MNFEHVPKFQKDLSRLQPRYYITKKNSYLITIGWKHGQTLTSIPLLSEQGYNWTSIYEEIVFFLLKHAEILLIQSFFLIILKVTRSKTHSIR